MALASVLLPAPPANARGGHGAVLHDDGPRAVAQRHGDGPGLPDGQQPAHGQVAASVDERRIDTHGLQAIEGRVHGHALGDATQVQANAARQRHRLIGGIQLDRAPTAAWTGHGQRARQARRQHLEGSVVAEADQLAQHRWVEYPIRGASGLQGRADDRKEQRADGDRLAGACIERREIAVRAETAQRLLPILE